MARLKRRSAVLEAARQRLAGLKSIDPAPEFGANISLAAFEAGVNALSNQLDGYNERLSGLDQLQNELDVAEAGVREMTVRILAAVGAAYGPDSSEYEQVGGTRRSDRKRSAPRSAKPQAQPAVDQVA